MNSFFMQRRRGSALLIVLGFLTFMMISAVSFAIYMRIERQASSNYRHTITGRHLLNAALYRAIDEIDSELRIDQTTANNGQVDVRDRKFPRWPGRTKPSAVPNGLDNGNDSRVLSLESLSFIPGIFVHDVRRYAVSNRNDIVRGVDARNNKQSYMGAKWRSISMPVASVVGGENAYEEAIVGRYSYVCVNLSDMFNVNESPASVRTNGVSLGHLFGRLASNPNNDPRKVFDEGLLEDGHYTTLQDFYACMYERDNTIFGSPYHEYLNAGEDYKADYVFSGLNGTLDASINANVLVTDGIVKQEPTRDISGVTFARRGGETPNEIALAAEAFAKQLVKVPRLKVNDAATGANLVKSMLVDYLDPDNTPFWESGIGISPLYRPSVEMTPQIFKLVLDPNQAGLKPATLQDGPENLKTHFLLLGNGQITLRVQTMYPFKDWEVRKQKEPDKFSGFKLEARAFLMLVPASQPLRTRAASSPFQMLAQSKFCFPLTDGGVQNDPMPNAEGTLIKTSPVVFNINGARVDLWTTDSTGGSATWLPTAPYPQGTQVRIALVVFAGISHNNKLVDMVPGYWFYGNDVPPTLDACISGQGGLAVCDRLFYQTKDIKLDMTLPSAPQMPYEWGSLEVPDPRHNHKASNWIVSQQAVAANSLDQTLAKTLVGQDGRDSDVYQFVSNGRNLQSAGEYGFLPRPYNNPAAMGDARVLADQTETTKAEDYDRMFRTIRLYDHDQQQNLSDDIYNYMPMATKDAILAGGRVNPCSDLPQVLNAAISSVPANFWVASLDPKNDKDRLLMMNMTFDQVVNQQDWSAITNSWVISLLRARTDPNGPQFARLWKNNLSDVYGDLKYFGWHNTDTKTIFGNAPVPATLNREFNEIDRKTLFAYSMDSFSDRQQLFLYILRAEATVPSFGTTQESGTKSLAGGRAVALVWRDPYPVGYDKQSDSWTGKGNATWFTYLNRISPWYQVNLGAYDDDHDANENSDSTFSGGQRQRFDGYHEHRILFFKQLDN